MDSNICRQLFAQNLNDEINSDLRDTDFNHTKNSRAIARRSLTAILPTNSRLAVRDRSYAGTIYPKNLETRKESGPLRANLRASCEEGIAFGGMVGLGETYFPAFALLVGGALVGAAILNYWEASVNGYLLLFAASSILRLACTLLLMRINPLP